MEIPMPSPTGNLIALGDPLRANTNLASLNLLNQLNALNRDLAVHQLRIATGRQQPRMEDGASFFVLWNKMQNQIRGKQMALDNIGDAKDELSLAETGLLQIDDLLGRMRDLVLRGANDTLTSEQRDDIHRELDQLATAIDEIVQRTRFNEGGAGEQLLLDGGFTHTYQVGPNEEDFLQVHLGNFLADALHVNVDENEVNVLNNDEARESIALIDFAINSVKDQLIDLGGLQSKLTKLEDILSSSIVAEESVASRFGDADLAREQVELAKLQLFNQLTTAQVATANTMPLQILGSLLGGQ
jgi:flagellin